MSHPGLTLKGSADIVATNGAHLVTKPNTPIFYFPPDSEATKRPFEEELTDKLLATFTQQAVRQRRYGSVALEYLPRHTPPEVREKREREMELLRELHDASSPSYSPEVPILPGYSNLILAMPDYTNIVATNGCRFITRPNTPI